MNKKNLVIIAIVLYLVSTGLTFGVLKVLGATGKPAEIIKPITVTPIGSRFKIDETIPRDQACPLNGKMYTKIERDSWEKRRPLAIMIENHKEARPQSGLSFSDIIYEAVAEGGITRFLAIFYCGAQAQDVQVGPVRSARTYFMDFLSEYGDKPLYVHVGGANTPGPANALGQIADYNWAGVNDLNQFSIGFPTFWRDYDRLGHEVATEHTMYSTTEKLWEYAIKKRNLTNVDEEGLPWNKNFTPYSFKEDLELSRRPESFSASFSFWPGYPDYEVKWEYDKTTNSFKRLNSGQPHLDLDNKEQLTAKNVVLLFMTERNANDGYENNAHLLYGTKGNGQATVLLDGKKVEVTWEKKTRTSHLVLKDKNTGKELLLNRGRIWFEVLPVGTKVSY